MIGGLLSEIWKAIRVVVWAFCLTILFVWKRFLCCKSSDDAFDETAERMEHKHPVEEYSWGSGKKETRPKTVHERAKQLDPVPVLYPETVEELKRIAKENARFHEQILKLDGNVVTVEAGIKIRHAIRVLEEHGLALKNMDNYNRQSLGGAIVGGTHGTSGSKRTDTFSSSIVQMTMINAKGEDVLLGLEDSVNFGSGGMVYEVTVRLVDVYYLEQKCINVDPMMLDFTKWWDPADSDFIMARWNFPGRKYEVCQLVEFRKATEAEYEIFRSTTF